MNDTTISTLVYKYKYIEKYLKNGYLLKNRSYINYDHYNKVKQARKEDK